MDGLQHTNKSGGQANATLPGWAILPLRLFLGVSFIIAGLDKLLDPTFLDPSARTYIGKQISGFATGTPLEGFLLNVAAPNAQLFGVMVMGGELCIGVAVLLGLLTRFSSAMGMLLNLTFFLSATWDIRPFYFGADLPYALGWLTLALGGPGPLALDHPLRHWLAGKSATVVHGEAHLPAFGRSAMTRRAFMVVGAAGLAGLALGGTGIGWGILHSGRSNAQAPAGQDTGQPFPGTTPSGTAPGNGVSPELAGRRMLVAGPGDLPVGQALDFVLPTGDPAVLVRTESGYSAYVAICTHQGCKVEPEATGLLRCPCHDARFDPADGAKPVAGPALKPLSPVAVYEEADGSVYLAEATGSR